MSPQEFLNLPVPPSRTLEMESWEQALRDLGPEAEQVFLDALERGTELEQHAALQALRLRFDYEASVEGHQHDLVYRIKPPGGDERLIKPSILPVPLM